MTQHDSDLIRLVPLLSAGEDIDNLEDAKLPLLDLCVQKSIRSYLRVPPGHVAVIYQYVKKEPIRSLFGRIKPVLAYKRGPVVERQVRFVALDVADIQDVRDAGSATVDGFLHGGLQTVRNGLLPIKFEYAVVQKDHPDPFAADRGFRAETLLEGHVYPITVTITAPDILVTVNDSTELRSSLGALAFEDKWGHKEAAPSVFLAYRASQDPYDLEQLTATLIANDSAGIFNRAMAITIARIIKVDVRPNAESEMAVDQISSNHFGKDYSDPALSKRMSLLLLATDCWIHDSQIRTETENRIKLKRQAIGLRQADPLIYQKQRDVLTREMLDFETKERAAIAHKLFMPSGLKAYLANLGFKNNQVEHLYRIITQSKAGGRHVTTENTAAGAQKLAKSRRVRSPSGNRPPSPA